MNTRRISPKPARPYFSVNDLYALSKHSLIGGLPLVEVDGVISRLNSRMTQLALDGGVASQISDIAGQTLKDNNTRVRVQPKILYNPSSSRVGFLTNLPRSVKCTFSGGFDPIHVAQKYISWALDKQSSLAVCQLERYSNEWFVDGAGYPDKPDSIGYAIIVPHGADDVVHWAEQFTTHNIPSRQVPLEERV